MNYEHLKQADPELYASMERELARQRDHLELIASENFTSPAVMEAVGTNTPRAIPARAITAAATMLTRSSVWPSTV